MYGEGTTALFKSINQESPYLFPWCRKEVIRIKLVWFDVIICYDQAIQHKWCAHRRLTFRTWALVQQVASIIAMQRADFLNCLNSQSHIWERNKLQCSPQFREYFSLMNGTWRYEISGGRVKNTIRITGTTLMYLFSTSVLAFLSSRSLFMHLWPLALRFKWHLFCYYNTIVLCNVLAIPWFSLEGCLKCPRCSNCLPQRSDQRCYFCSLLKPFWFHCSWL